MSRKSDKEDEIAISSKLANRIELVQPGDDLYAWLDESVWRLKAHKKVIESDKIEEPTRFLTGDLIDAAKVVRVAKDMTLDECVSALKKQVMTTPHYHKLEHEVLKMRYQIHMNPNEFVRELKRKLTLLGRSTTDESLKDHLINKIPDWLIDKATASGALTRLDKLTTILVNHHNMYGDQQQRKKHEEGRRCDYSHRDDVQRAESQRSPRRDGKRYDKRNHRPKRYENNQRTNDLSDHPRKCYECGDPNHLRSRCPKLNNKTSEPIATTSKPVQHQTIAAETNSDVRNVIRLKDGNFDMKGYELSCSSLGIEDLSDRECEVTSISKLFNEPDFESKIRSDPELKPTVVTTEKTNPSDNIEIIGNEFQRREFPRTTVKVYIGRDDTTEIEAACDSCSHVSIVDAKLAQLLKWELRAKPISVHGVENRGRMTLGSVFTMTRLKGSEECISLEFLVMSDFRLMMLLGVNALSHYEVDVQLRRDVHRVVLGSSPDRDFQLEVRKAHPIELAKIMAPEEPLKIC